MADAEHLKILGQGVEAWNQWREENESTKPDLSKAGIFKRNLSRANLKRANLKGTFDSFLRPNSS